MNEKKFINVVQKITMPEQMAENLMHDCMNLKQTGRAGAALLKRTRLTAAAIMAALLVGISSTSYAAYHIYQIKNLNVFFDSDITQERIDEIGREINDISGVYSVRFVNADEAWETFQKTYLEDMDDLAVQFSENPLKDSYSYRVKVKLDSNTDVVRDLLEQLAGVRLVSNLRDTGQNR